MKENIIKKGNRAVGIAECILEGYSIREASEEYCISERTARRDLDYLVQNGYGQKCNQRKKNQILGVKALQELQARQKK